MIRQRVWVYPVYQIQVTTWGWNTQQAGPRISVKKVKIRKWPFQQKCDTQRRKREFLRVVWSGGGDLKKQHRKKETVKFTIRKTWGERTNERKRRKTHRSPDDHLEKE
ncbi:hypothetical protein pipiens_010249 [Culex pipiens pipiens]|uniref:Uncharacterized protein n=1 Tax=Culex pipiens pipiens TaxID=38569 RepID=A0ABD1DAW2_CULPP